MSRIPLDEFAQIKEMVSSCRASDFTDFKRGCRLPDPKDVSRAAAESARDFLVEAFINRKFTLLDAIVAMTGRGPATHDDTHYRGRALEEVLDGSFDGKCTSDFGYAELKLVETRDPHTLVQIMNVGRIFSRENGNYEIVNRFEDSNFYKKINRMLVVSYKKVGRQLGFSVNGVFLFELQNPAWFSELKDDWECIRDAMIRAIDDEKNGAIVRKKSGILSSRLKTPNGYLKVRSDSVVISDQFFKIISSHK